jgi:hypothetical protein
MYTAVELDRHTIRLIMIQILQYITLYMCVLSRSLYCFILLTNSTQLYIIYYHYPVFFSDKNNVTKHKHLPLTVDLTTDNDKISNSIKPWTHTDKNNRHIRWLAQFKLMHFIKAIKRGIR